VPHTEGLQTFTDVLRIIRVLFKEFIVVWQGAGEENQNVSSCWRCMLELLFYFCCVCHRRCAHSVLTVCSQCANMNMTGYRIVGDEENFLGKSFEVNTVAFCVSI